MIALQLKTSFRNNTENKVYCIELSSRKGKVEGTLHQKKKLYRNLYTNGRVIIECIEVGVKRVTKLSGKKVFIGVD